MKLTLKAIGLAALLAGTSLATQHFIRPALACEAATGSWLMQQAPEPSYQVINPPPTVNLCFNGCR